MDNSKVIDAEVVTVPAAVEAAGGGRADAAKVFVAAIAKGCSQTQALRLAMPERYGSGSGVSEVAVQVAASRFARSDDVAAQQDEMRAYYGIQLLEMLGDFKQAILFRFINPIIAEMLEREQDVADIPDDRLRGVLLAKVMECNAMRGEGVKFKSAVSNKEFSMASGVLQRLAEVAQGGKQVGSGATIKVAILNGSDGRERFEGRIPTAADDWVYDRDKSQMVHRASFELGKSAARGAFGDKRCHAGGVIPGHDQDKCYMHATLGASAGAG